MKILTSGNSILRKLLSTEARSLQGVLKEKDYRKGERIAEIIDVEGEITPAAA